LLFIAIESGYKQIEMIKRYSSKCLSIPAIIKHNSWLYQVFVTLYNPKGAGSNPASTTRNPLQSR
jgi:hypothetical protein